jgi:hypothetical protein
MLLAYNVLITCLYHTYNILKAYHLSLSPVFHYLYAVSELCFVSLRVSFMTHQNLFGLHTNLHTGARLVTGCSDNKKFLTLYWEVPCYQGTFLNETIYSWGNVSYHTVLLKSDIFIRREPVHPDTKWGPITSERYTQV